MKTIVDGVWLTESARLRMLADEEHAALGLDIEYRSSRNAVTSMRQMHPATTAMVHTLPGEVEQAVKPAARSEIAKMDRVSADEGCFSAGAAEAV